MVFGLVWNHPVQNHCLGDCVGKIAMTPLLIRESCVMFNLRIHIISYCKPSQIRTLCYVPSSKTRKMEDIKFI